MSYIFESSAVITVKKTFNLQNSTVFEVLPKMLQVVYQSDLIKLCSPILRNIMAKYEALSTSVFRKKY